MTITKPRLVVTAVLGGVATGVIGDAIWDGIKYTVSRIGVHVPQTVPMELTQELVQLSFFVLVGLAGVWLGGLIERGSFSSLPSTLGVPRRPPPRSKIFILEVVGSLPLDDPNTDWKFFLTNCTGRMLRAVTLYNIQSDLGTYRLGFREIPFVRPFEKVELHHELWSRRMSDFRDEVKPTLWEFANDITGIGRSSYIWYKILVEYREAEDEAVHCGDFLFVCFDLPAKRLKTGGIVGVLGTKFDDWDP